MKNTQNYDERPDRLLRLREVLSIIPVGKSSWWLGVRDGRYPAPVRLGSRTVAWKESDIMRIVEMGVQE